MAVASVGTKLKKGTTEIAELTSIGGLELSAETIDTTTLDSTGGYRTFINGFKDGGEVSISGFFNPTSHKGLYDDFEAGTVSTYTIEFPAGINAKWEFSAVVTAYSTSAELEDAIAFEATLKVSGKPTLNLTGSGS